MQPKAKQALQEIWRAETKVDAERAFDGFLSTYDLKYPKATACLQKDQAELLMFYAFPAAHWPSLRITNPNESTFGTIRHRTTRTKGCLARDGMLHMMFKFWQCAEKTLRRLRRFNELPKVIAGIRFTDGIEQLTTDSVAASATLQARHLTITLSKAIPLAIEICWNRNSQEQGPQMARFQGRIIAIHHLILRTRINPYLRPLSVLITHAGYINFLINPISSLY